jgi:hypothetical protein
VEVDDLSLSHTQFLEWRIDANCHPLVSQELFEGTNRSLEATGFLRPRRLEEVNDHSSATSW